MQIVNLYKLWQVNLGGATFFLALGGGLGPLLQLLAIHSLARLYSPSDFGNLALFLSAAGVLIAVSCLRYEFVITKVEERYASASSWLAILSVFFTSCVVFLFLMVDMPMIFFPQVQALGWRVWVIPIFCICGGVILVGLQTTLRRGEFKLHAVFRSSQTVFYLLIALIFDSLKLIDSIVLAGIILSLMIIIYIFKTTPIVRLSEIWELAREYKKYPTYLVPTSFIDAAALAAPVFFISYSYGAEATGSYFQIQKIIGAPLGLAAMVAGQLFLKNSSEIYRAGLSSSELLWKYFRILALIALIVTAFVYVGGEYIFAKILGQGWRVDSYFLILLTIPIVVRLSVSSMSTVFITHNCVTMLSMWQCAYFLSTFSVLYLASANFTFENFLVTFALHELIAYSIYLFIGNLVAKKVKT